MRLLWNLLGSVFIVNMCVYILAIQYYFIVGSINTIALGVVIFVTGGIAALVSLCITGDNDWILFKDLYNKLSEIKFDKG